MAIMKEVIFEHLSINWMTTALVFFATFFLVSYGYGWLQGQRLPPGLPRLPIVGSLPYLWGVKQDHTTYQKLAKKFGPIFRYYLGSQLVVVLSSYEAIHDALIKKARDFSDRPYRHYFGAKLQNVDGKGVIEDSWGPRLMRQRNVTISVLKSFGFGRNIMENAIKTEVERLTSLISENAGEPLQIAPYITNSVSNVICGILFGKHFDYDDPRFQTIINSFEEHFKAGAVVHDLKWMPFLRFLPSHGKAFAYHLKVYMESKEYIRQELEEHERLALDKDPQRDFVSAYKHMSGEALDPEMLLMVARNFFIAGTDTTANSIKFSMIFMANNQDVQSKVREEIETVIGERSPCLSDRQNMKYTEAVLLETFRRIPILPYSVPHYTKRDTDLHGYFVPGNTEVFVDLWSVQMNPEEWTDPYRFDPQRFLDEEGNLINRDRVVLFSMGRRACLGEPLAKQELFLFFATIIQRFKVTPPVGVTTISEDPVYGMTLSPQPFHLRFTPV